MAAANRSCITVGRNRTATTFRMVTMAASAVRMRGIRTGRRSRRDGRSTRRGAVPGAVAKLPAFETGEWISAIHLAVPFEEAAMTGSVSELDEIPLPRGKRRRGSAAWTLVSGAVFSPPIGWPDEVPILSSGTLVESVAGGAGVEEELWQGTEAARPGAKTSSAERTRCRG